MNKKNRPGIGVPERIESQSYGVGETDGCPEVDRECGDYRHWSPTSQTLAPADVLLQYLSYGWKLDNTIYVKSFCCLRTRSVDVFYFLLTRDDEQVQIPVLANPTVHRLIQESGSTVLRLIADSGANRGPSEELTGKQTSSAPLERKSAGKKLFAGLREPCAQIG